MGHDDLVKAAICAALFVVACKSESKPADKAEEKPTPTETAHQARPRPTLPDSPGGSGAMTDDGRARPRLPEDGEPRDWTDPSTREEMRAMRDQRRKEREAQLDANKDGVLSPEEKAQRVAPMLKRMDANGDGKLTPDELSSSDRRMGFDDPAAVDTDKNGEISLVELEAAVTARREKMREKWKGGRGGRGGMGGEPK
jgi:hypothetical protein